MPYCPRCGVEVDPSVRACPLCSTPVPRFDDLGPGEPSWPFPGEPDDPAKVYSTPRELRSRAFLGTAAVFATAALAVTFADLFTTGALTWARYALVSIAAAFACIASVVAWRRRPAAWVGAWFAVITGLLAALDFADGTLGWFPTLGLPLTAATFLLCAGGAVVIRRSSRKGYNLFALVFSLVAVELGVIDVLVTAWASGQPGLGWSLVTALVLVPLAVLFLLLHLILPRTPDLRRTFHF